MSTPPALSLGLRPMGILASRVILMLTGLINYLAGTLLMVVALRRIHAQMRTAKAAAVGRARTLAAEALRPITTGWSTDALEAQAQVLAAAERVERRTAAIQEWPIDDAILTRIAAILTAVGATIVARLILSSFGL